MNTMFVFAALVAAYLKFGQIGMSLMAVVIIAVIALVPARTK